MARIFITGSADGLGRMAGELLIEQGHRVVLHARSQARADETKRNLPQADILLELDFRIQRAALTLFEMFTTYSGWPNEYSILFLVLIGYPIRKNLCKSVDALHRIRAH